MKQWIPAGITAAIGLGVFLRAIEQITGSKVYTLLLNVDYIPVLNRVERYEIIEFSLHVIVSLLLAGVVWAILKRRSWSGQQKAIFTLTVSLLIGVLLYPSTLLSSRTPELYDITAILWWMLGHLLYGFLLLIYPAYRSRSI
jgi:hypothetical protein